LPLILRLAKYKRLFLQYDASSLYMKKGILLALTILFIGISCVKGQEAPPSAYLVKGPIPKVASGNNQRIMGLEGARLDYIKSDSEYFPNSYFMNYMFYMNSRYTESDTGIGLTNEYLLQGFGVMFDTLRDEILDTTYLDSNMRNVTIDSLSIFIGQCNHSGSQDTIIVQIDSIDATTGYLFPKVLHSDTIFTVVGLSPSNNWLNPVYAYVRPNYILPKYHKFAVMVSYYGSKLDTMGFLPGFGYSNCISGGSGPVPKDTRIGYTFGTLRANSISWGYSYFFGGRTDTIPTISGSTSGIIVPCANPNSRFWYLQDNPIDAYISFNNVTGINEVKVPDYAIGQNRPNPFNQVTEITYDLNKVSDVEFFVTDLTGRKLVSSTYSKMANGRHSITLNASQFSPGIYLYTFIVNGSAVTRKMVVTQ
jgi:hypothetical protein